MMAANGRHPMVPRLHRVRRRWRESHDTVTIALEALDSDDVAYEPGQFNMLYRFGVGEVPISISGRHRPGKPLLHTIRAVGAVTEALCQARTGEVVGVRGPFGTSWGVQEAEGADLVLVAGGIGLAPLRSALHSALARRRRFGRLVLLVGARSPGEVVFRRELARLGNRHDLVAEVTVDRAGSDWRHHVGVVTQLVPGVPFDPESALALVCGPEVMMRFAATALLGRGMPPERIRVSLERNMQCAIGWCGHCQLGPEFVCRDGPVRTWAQTAPLLAVKER
jgi:NAD(P)H-flavin reductase